MTEPQVPQISAASIMAARAQLPAPQLTAQQLTALAAASGGAVFIPNLMSNSAFRLPSMTAANPFIPDMAMLTQGFSFPSMATPVQQQSQLPQTSSADAAAQQVAMTTGYRDFSRSGDEHHSISKDHSFPMKLHKILSDPENSDYITWLPHGRSWRVLKPKAFEEKIIPKYFRHAKYASFMRQVNGWGFKRMTQGPDHNSYYHELFLRGLPKLCQKMKRPAKTSHGMTMPSPGAHPDFYSMSLYAPLPEQVIPAAAPTVATSTMFSGSDTSDQGGFVTNSSLSASVSTSYPGTSSDSDRHGMSSDSDRNGGSSRDDSGGSDEGDRNTSGGSSDSRDESAHGGLSCSDRNSGYNEDSGSDPGGSDVERLSGSDAFESSSSPRSLGRKRSSNKRNLIDRADSSVRGSDSSERSSVRDLSFLTASLAANKQADVPMTIGGNLQDMATWGAGGLPAGMAVAFSGLGQSHYAALPFSAPLTAATLSTVNQPSSANLSAANQGAGTQQPSAPLTASNLSYLSLQNQLIQSQATIAKLLTYQKQMGLPPMPAAVGDQLLPAATGSTQPSTANQEEQGGST